MTRLFFSHRVQSSSNNTEPVTQEKNTKEGSMFFACVIFNEPANRKRFYERKFNSNHSTHIRQIFGNVPDIQVVAVSFHIHPDVLWWV